MAKAAGAPAQEVEHVVRYTGENPFRRTDGAPPAAPAVAVAAAATGTDGSGDSQAALATATPKPAPPAPPAAAPAARVAASATPRCASDVFGQRVPARESGHANNNTCGIRSNNPHGNPM